MSIQKTLITPIQQALHDSKIPAWLFYGFHNVDPIATQILRFQPKLFATRRWFYLIPARGEPKKLFHHLESKILDHLPGKKDIYLKWQQLQSSVKNILGDFATVAMPKTAIHKFCCLFTLIGNIRITRQIFIMKPVSKTI